MEQTPRHHIDKKEQEEQESRGIVTIPYLKEMSVSSSGELLTDICFKSLSSLEER